MNVTNDLIIFDWDDTLMKTIPYLRAPLHQVLFEYVKEHLEPDLTREEFEVQNDEFYKELRSTIRGWLRKHGRPEEEQDVILRLATKPMVDAVAAETIRNEERLARLRRLKELGYTIVILTHNYREYCWALMQQFGYDEFFEKRHVYDLPTVRHHKTTVQAYQHVLDDLNREFDKIHMVDDTDINLKCAKELGMMTYHVVGENALSEGAVVYTDYAFYSVDDAMDYLIQRAA